MASIMIDSEYFKKIITTVILAILLVLSFLVLKPILLSIIMGIILAIVFTPPYDWLLGKLKFKWLALTLTCIFIILLIVLPLWLLTPIFIKQAFEIFVAAQKIDFTQLLTNAFPTIASEQYYSQFHSILGSFITNSLTKLMESLSQWILNFPTILLQLIVVFATFFFVLKDKEEILDYFRSLMPFSKDVEKRLFQSSTDITLSVVYGQIVIGLIQGLIAGIGFMIFQVPNTIFLTSLAIVAGIIPMVGPSIVWIPVVIFLLVNGSSSAAVGVTLFGLISAVIDNFLRPLFISKRAKLHPLISLMGMIGGFFFFGILGFIIGPLILAYVIIILELYRGKDVQGFFVKQE